MELETTQAVVARVVDWTKLLAYFVAIPLGLLALVLATLGVKTFNDLISSIDKAKQTTAQTLAEAQQQASRIREQAQTLRAEYESLNADLEQTKALRARVESLSTKVEQIERVVRFQPSAGLTPALQDKLAAYLGRFYAYMQGIGFRAAGGIPTVKVGSQNLNAYYSASNNEILLHADLAGEVEIA